MVSVCSFHSISLQTWLKSVLLFYFFVTIIIVNESFLPVLNTDLMVCKGMHCRSQFLPQDANNNTFFILLLAVD